MDSIVKFIPASKPKVTFMEESQENVVLFSFAQRTEWNDSFKQMHHFVRCRDFLGDVIYSNWSKENQEIYRFSVDPTVDVLDSENTLLFVKKDKLDFEIDLYLLHDFEERNGFKITRVVKTDHPDTYLFIGDRKWQSSIFLMSFYSLMLKVIMICPEDSWKGTFEWFDNNYCKESFYMKTLRKNFDNLAENLHKFVISDEKDPSGCKQMESITTIHNYCGWVSIVSGGCSYENKLKDIWNRILSGTNPVPVVEKLVETEKVITLGYGTTINIASHVDSLGALQAAIDKYYEQFYHAKKGPSLMIHDDLIVPFGSIKPKKKKAVKKKKPDPFYHALYQKELKAGLKGLA